MLNGIHMGVAISATVDDLRILPGTNVVPDGAEHAAPPPRGDRGRPFRAPYRGVARGRGAAGRHPAPRPSGSARGRDDLDTRDGSPRGSDCHHDDHPDDYPKRPRTN